MGSFPRVVALLSVMIFAEYGVYGLGTGQNGELCRALCDIPGTSEGERNVLWVAKEALWVTVMIALAGLILLEIAQRLTKRRREMRSERNENLL